MRILILSALYPPYAFGGAEDCARGFAEWAAGAGHEVAVLMAARAPEEADRSTVSARGVRVTMVATPHVYPVSLFDKAAAWQKPVWHLQDHLDGRAGAAIAAQVAAFAPDVIVIHYIQGFGYRALASLAACGVPVAFVLHDLGLACIRMSMFRAGRSCRGQCLACRASGAYKGQLIERLAAAVPLGFIAPSQAIIDELDRYVPVKRHAHARILNTKAYPQSARHHGPSDVLRLLYVGKLDRTKGIDVLLPAVAQLAETAPVTLTIAGTGPLEGELRATYGSRPWARFLGFVSQETLADEMVDADILCVPSLWQENSPGVVIQALGAGLPVMASDRGGLPELVQDGRNGLLLRRCDSDDWLINLRRLNDDRMLLAQLRSQATAERAGFDVDTIGRQTIDFLSALIAGRKSGD